MGEPRKQKPIDRVTTNNLDAALRMCNVEIHVRTLDLIIDLVELLEDKGDKVTIKDIFDFQELRKQGDAENLLE
jgi:predicted RNA-binding protein